MTKRRLLLSSVLVLLTASAPWTSARATTVAVPELGDLRASAFSLDPFFSVPSPPEAFGDFPTATVESALGDSADPSLDVDWYSFTAAAGAQAYFDVDDPAIDTMLALFDGSGTLLAFDDDAGFPFDPGSTTLLASFIGVITLPATDTYYLAISAFDRQPLVIFEDECGPPIEALVRPDGGDGGEAFDCSFVAGEDSYFGAGGETGPYTLHATIVPEPSTGLLLASGLAGFGVARRVGRACTRATAARGAARAA